MIFIPDRLREMEIVYPIILCSIARMLSIVNHSNSVQQLLSISEINDKCLWKFLLY